MNNDLMVSIRCIAYNQERYIRQCLEGFVMQQTNFRYEAVVHDDASTDKTADIIREFAEKYPDVIKPIYEAENQYSKHDGSLKRIMDEACSGKYVAMCEGDDYWIDPSKLQKQVDFLEKNPEFSMCFHAADVLNEIGAIKYIDCENIEDKEYFTKDIFPRWVVPTASVVYRRSVVNEYPMKHREMLCYGDICLFLTCMEVGRVWGMSDKMSVYRINNGGVTQTVPTPDYRKWIDHEKCLRMNFPKLDRKMMNRHISSYYYSLAKNDDRLLLKVVDFLKAFGNSPKYVMGKIGNIIKRDFR